MTSSLFRFALRLTRNWDDAEDLLQETMIRAWQHGNEGKNWLCRVMVNAWLDELRKRRCRPQIVAEEDGRAVPSPDDLHEQVELRLEIQRLSRAGPFRHKFKKALC